MNGLQIATRWLTHPITVAATAVLLLNDHVLKDLWPSWFTGKLSDLGGLTMAPALLAFGLAVAAPRLPAGLLRAVAVLSVGAGFVWVKTFEAGAQFASQLWSVVNGPSVILRDPTDLVALPGLAVAWFVFGRARRGEPLATDTARRVRLAVVLPVAAVAVAATSASPLPDAVIDVAVADGRIRVSGTFGTAVSESGTGDWHWESGAVDEDGRRFEPYEMASELKWRRQVMVCVPSDPEHCYRVRGDGVTDPSGEPADSDVLGVDESVDGGRLWTGSWEIPAERWLFLKYSHDLPDESVADGLLSSMDITVRERPDGHEVFVANGMEGLAVRDVEGRWSRVAVELPATGSLGPVDIRPLPLSAAGVGTAAELAASALIVGLALWGLAPIAWLLRRGGPRPRLWVPMAGASALLVVSLFLYPAVRFFIGAQWFYALLTVGVAVAGTLGLTLALADRGWRYPVLSGGGSLAAGVGFYLPYFGWSLGVPPAYPRHWGLIAAGVVFGATALLAVVLRVRDGRRRSAPAPRPP